MKLWAAERTYWHECAHIVGNIIAGVPIEDTSLQILFSHEGTSFCDYRGRTTTENFMLSYVPLFLVDGCKYTKKEIELTAQSVFKDWNYFDTIFRIDLSDEKNIDFILETVGKLRDKCGDAPGKLEWDGTGWVWRKFTAGQFIKAVREHADSCVGISKKSQLRFFAFHVTELVANLLRIDRNDWRPEVY